MVFAHPRCKTRLVPKLKEKFGGPYLQRITVLYAVKALMQSGDSGTLKEDLVELATKGAKDSVCNVRLVAAATLGVAFAKFGKGFAEENVE